MCESAPIPVVLAVCYMAYLYQSELAYETTNHKNRTCGLPHKKSGISRTLVVFR